MRERHFYAFVLALALACLVASTLILSDDGEPTSAGIEVGERARFVIELRRIASTPLPPPAAPEPTVAPTDPPEPSEALTAKPRRPEEMPVSYVADCEGPTCRRHLLEPLVWDVFGDQAPTAIRLITCESDWNPNAVSPTDDHGLMQINAPTWADDFAADWADVYDPRTNLELGRRVLAAQGWGAWTCY